MNNEILEEIKERYTNPPVVEVIDGINYALIDLKNLEWLIEQAQRSLYLEEREKEIIDINQHETKYRQELESINMELNQKNKHYREALEYIGNHVNDSEWMSNVVDTKLIKAIIREALEELK